MYKIIPFLVLLMASCSKEKDRLEDIKKEYKKGNFSEVIKTCSAELSKIDKKDTLYKPLIQYRAGCHMRLSDYKSAIEDYKMLIAINPNDISNYSGLSFAYWSNKDTLQGLAALEKSATYAPDDALLLNTLSYDCAQAKQYEKSRDFAVKGLEQNPDKGLKGLLLSNRGFALLKLNQYDSASKYLDQAVLEAPENSFAYCYRAMLNIALDKPATVCTDLERAKKAEVNQLTEDLIAKYCKK